MTNEVVIPREIVTDSRDSASALFAAVNIQLVWAGQKRAAPFCAGESAVTGLMVEIVAHAPADVSNDALAMALFHGDSGVRIVVFYDRVDRLISAHRAPPGKLLGHVLAHEIAHVLEGVPHHSETGLMRAHWTDNDFRQMSSSVLMFANEDAMLMRRHLLVSAGQSRDSEVIARAH